MSNYNTQGADKGFVLRYDKTDQSKTTYFRLCGYYGGKAFVQIGYFDFMWCCNSVKMVILIRRSIYSWFLRHLINGQVSMELMIKGF